MVSHPQLQFLPQTHKRKRCPLILGKIRLTPDWSTGWNNKWHTQICKEIYVTWKHSSMIPEWLKYLQTLWKIFKKCPPKMLTGLLRIYKVPLDSEKHPLANLEIPLSFPLPSSPMMEHKSKLNLLLIWDILDLWFTRTLSPNTESKPIPYSIHWRYTMLMALTIPEAKLRNLQSSIYRSKITSNKSVFP